MILKEPKKKLEDGEWRWWNSIWMRQRKSCDCHQDSEIGFRHREKDTRCTCIRNNPGNICQWCGRKLPHNIIFNAAGGYVICEPPKEELTKPMWRNHEPSRDPLCPHFRLEKDPRNPGEYVCVDCLARFKIEALKK